jgi:cell division protein FtsB
VSARAAQVRRPTRTVASDLRVVRRRSRSLIKRTGSRRTAPLLIVGVIAVVGIIAGVLITQVVLAQSAFKLQEIDRRLTQAEARQEELLADMALLESPGRIERYARQTLGMVEPTTVEYIVANVKTGSDNRLAEALERRDVPLPGAGTAAGTTP